MLSRLGGAPPASARARPSGAPCSVSTLSPSAPFSAPPSSFAPPPPAPRGCRSGVLVAPVERSSRAWDTLRKRTNDRPRGESSPSGGGQISSNPPVERPSRTPPPPPPPPPPVGRPPAAFSIGPSPRCGLLRLVLIASAFCQRVCVSTVRKHASSVARRVGLVQTGGPGG